jgi:GDP-L-fucose synthase
MDSSKFRNLGWEPKINLEEGIQNTYNWFLKNIAEKQEIKGLN